MRLSCYEELKIALKRKMMPDFFLWVILWYTPVTHFSDSCVSDKDRFFRNFPTGQTFCDMLVTCHWHFQLSWLLPHLAVSPIDKNVNYFSQDFTAAPVSMYEMSKDCPSVADINALLKKFPANISLAGINNYGSDNAPITWQSNDSTNSFVTLYLTLDKQNTAIGLKHATSSTLWLAVVSAPETVIWLQLCTCPGRSTAPRSMTCLMPSICPFLDLS